MTDGQDPARQNPARGGAARGRARGQEDWARYWRSPERRLEAMRAHFRRHAYDRHSHDSYSFGVTESGAQTFRCRGSRHTSVAGMVMAFNPDEAHDGRCATGDGFTYAMIHIGADLLAAEFAEVAERPGALPLFTEPAFADLRLAAALSRLHAALAGPATLLAVDEHMLEAALLLTRHAGASPGRTAGASQASRMADRVRALVRESYLGEVGAADLAAAAGGSRHAAYRAFRARYGMAPSEYQRLLRLRRARSLLADGTPAAQAAAAAGFADQAHLTRWFRRCYGITPGAYQRALTRLPGRAT